MHAVDPSTNGRSPAERAMAILLVVFAGFAPWSIAIAESSVVLMAMLAAVTALTTIGVSRRHRNWPWLLRAVAFFLVIQAISIPLGIHPMRSLRCFRGSWVLLFPFVFWIAAREVRSRRTALATLIGSSGLAGFYGVVQHFLGSDVLHGDRLENYGDGGFVAVGNLNSHLTYAGALLPVLFLAIASTFAARGWRRLLGGTAALSIGLGLLVSFTRTAWIGAAAGLLVFGFLRGRRTVLVAIGALTLVTGMATLAEPAFARRLLSIFQSADDPRWRLWQTALHIVDEHPWIGAGLGSFKTLFPIYKVPGEYMSTIHPHHDLLNVMVESGWIGGVAWILIWVAFFREAGTKGIRDRGLTDGMIAGVAALLVAGLGQCYATDEEVAQIWWFLATAAILESGRTADRPLARGLTRGLKAATLPFLRELFAPPRRLARARPALPTTAHRLLLIRPDNRLGNLILLTPFFRRLREARPDAEITLALGDAYAPLVRGFPWLDRFYVQEKRRQAREPWRFLEWVRVLRRQRFDLAFELSNHNTHSYYSCALALLSGAPERIGFDEPRNDSTLTLAVPPAAPRDHFSLAPLRLLRALGMVAPAAPMSVPLTDPASRTLTEYLRREGLERRRYVVVHLGGRDAKAWPLEAWARTLSPLAEALAQPLVVVAGPGEVNRLSTLRPDGSWLAAPLLPITDLGHLLREAALFVGCDSGVMHLAIALECPTVALFFRSNPWHYAPLGGSHRTVLLANPYRVDDAWDEPAEGCVRSPIVRVASSAADDERGFPAIGDDAVAALVGAAASARRDVGERAESTRRP